MKQGEIIKYKLICLSLDSFIWDNKEQDPHMRYSLAILTPEEEEEELKEWLEKNHTTSFQQDLMRLIDEHQMTDVEFYKAALLDRKLFSAIRNNIYYIPSKETALVCCLALRLDLPEAEALLKKAGVALNHTSTRDLIVEYCITHQLFELDVVNTLLDHYGERTLRV